ncbi:hypothetical protein VMCG_10479 [Cytospora schulzeri]|uniref:FAD/NAD(P)-binding domain-containing protein n=1 Tax=Cytospora schulzeri TaxID=448051 RepID=A0A423VBI5_9PEZI|nr:hypothetical protein VMCG_10479 [Valsa malicola]
MNVRSVAVIGAGPAGAAAADALAKEERFETVRVFDRRSLAGGTWVYTPDASLKIPDLRDLLEGNADSPVPVPSNLPAETPKSVAVNNQEVRYADTALHEHLHGNHVPSLFGGIAEPRGAGPGAPFKHREVVREWIEGVFVHNGLQKFLELNTTVERAEKKGSKWVLTLRKELGQRNYWWEERFDALIVASGHYNVPWMPKIDGLVEFDAKFPGRILHAKHFRDGSRYHGKRVIVVGGSVSAYEIIGEVLPYAQHPVYASLRGDPDPAFGWKPWKDPHIAVQKQITRLDPTSGRIFFEDDTYLDDVDHVIFGTGYTFSLPFLPVVQERIRRAHRRIPGIWQHTWNIDDPTLALIGMLNGGFTFRVYEWQAVAVARFFAGRSKPLPPVEEQRDWERKRVAALRGGKAYYSIAPHHAEFFELLRDIAGKPGPGMPGRPFPSFDKAWAKVWMGRVAENVQGWEQARKKSREGMNGKVRAKL